MHASSDHVLITKHRSMQIMASKNNFTMKTKYGAVATVTIPLIVIGGAYVAFSYINRGGFWRKRNPRVRKRSVSMGALHGGKMALQRLVEYQEARADVQNLNALDDELSVLLEEDHQIDFPRIQRIAARLEMSGHEDKAVEILEKEHSKALEDRKVHEAYEIEMLLVEMLIYKGEFERALNCECLKDENISDARRPLFEAIIRITLEQPESKEKARECWEKFNEVRECFNDPPSFKESIQETLEGEGICKLATSFNDFEKIVKRLRDDIYKAQKKKKKNSS